MLVMHEARGGGLRAGMWGTGNQRGGYGGPSERGDASVHVCGAAGLGGVSGWNGDIGMRHGVTQSGQWAMGCRLGMGGH